VAAERKVEAARAGTREAKAARVADIARAASSGNEDVTAGAGVVRAARLSELDAQDELEAVKAGLAKLEADLPDAEEEGARLRTACSRR